MKRGYADTPEGQIHYVVQGEGVPLILLHATPQSSRAYWKLAPLLAKECRVFTPDTLGFGNSGPLPPSVKIEDFARSFVHFMDALDIQKAHVFGLHTGNKVAVALAAGWPERVESVMLCGSPHSIIPDKTKRDVAIFNLVDVIERRFEPAPGGSDLLRAWALAYGRIANAWWDTATFSQQKLTPEHINPLERRVLDMVQARLTDREAHEAIFAYDWGAGLRKIKAKTLFVELVSAIEEARHGRQGEGLTKIVPNSKLATLENANGNAIEVRTEELARVILDFVKGR